MKNGVPWGDVWTMDGEEVMAAVVVFAAFEGNDFDWRIGRWRDRK